MWNKTIFSFLIFSVVLLAKDTLVEIESLWSQTKSYTADFSQTVESKRTKTKTGSGGKIWVQKPGKLRWESETERITQLLNAKTFTMIQTPRRRSKRTVDIYKDISKLGDTRPLAFLSGEAPLKQTYDPKLISEDMAKVSYRLIPVKGGSETYIAEFSKNGYRLTALTIDSSDSHVRIELSDIKTNVPIAPKLFEYTKESGDVVQNH